MKWGLRSEGFDGEGIVLVSFDGFSAVFWTAFGLEHRDGALHVRGKRLLRRQRMLTSSM